jgi:hypothetical protein
MSRPNVYAATPNRTATNFARPAEYSEGTVKELYASLPEDVRQSLREQEFEEFIEAAINAGVASEEGEVVEVLSTGESVFRLKIV